MSAKQSIAAIQDEIVEDFEFLDEWSDKYGHIIEVARDLEAFPEAHRTEENKVKGCQSQVWLHLEEKDGVLTFYGDSDAMIVKGLVSLLVKVYSGHSAKEIMDSDLYFIDKIGLSTHLSPTRSNGLAAMNKQIRLYAFALASNS